MTGREVPRSVQALIVRDLARNHRTADAIARRHHVPRELVDALKQQHGPDPESLIRAADNLDRPAGHPAPPVAAPKVFGNSDGLTVEERAACRAWALTTHRTASAAGPLSRALVAEWNDMGRPTAAPQPPAVPEAAPDATEAPSEPEEVTEPEPATVDEELVNDEIEEPDKVVIVGCCFAKGPQGFVCAQEQGHAGPHSAPDFCDPWPNLSAGEAIKGKLFDSGGVLLPGMTVAVNNSGRDEHVTSDDEIVDVEIVPFWSDWDLLFARADAALPPVTTAWIDVEEAVERLRDALREHDHHEQLVRRVQDAIKPHLHLTLNQVRLVLDAIEAA